MFFWRSSSMVLVGLGKFAEFGELEESDVSSGPSGRGRPPRGAGVGFWAPPLARAKNDPSAAAEEIHSKRRRESSMRASEAGATQQVPRRTQCYTLARREYDVQSLREFARVYDRKRAARGVHSGAGTGVQPLAAASYRAAGAACNGFGGARGASARAANAGAGGWDLWRGKRDSVGGCGVDGAARIRDQRFTGGGGTECGGAGPGAGRAKCGA